MGQRIETRTVDTGGGAKTTVIQTNACELFWISLSAETDGIKGSVKIYDDVDAGGKLKWQCEPAREHYCLFDPPIPCDQGACIVTDANIACYTVAYRSKGWMAKEE